MVDGPNGPGGVETVSVSVNGVSSPVKRDEGTPSSDSGGLDLRAEGGVTQGELLRQEQRAGIVPAAQLQSHGEDDEEVPHARGPEEVGMEDLGPQGGTSTQRGGPGVSMQGIDVEAAVGRRIEVDREREEGKDTSEDGMDEGPEDIKTPKREAEDERSGDEKRLREAEEGRDDDKDVVLADVDGRTEDEAKLGDKGETKGADAVDMSDSP